jgi:hypothetical protein
MKQPHLFVKIGVITSSVVLAAGCIAYRAGAFNWFTADKPTTMGGSKSKPLVEPVPPDTKPVDSSPSLDLPIMSGSKSAILIVPPATATETKQAPTIMPGSKASFTPVISVPPTPPKSSPPSK